MTGRLTGRHVVTYRNKSSIDPDLTERALKRDLLPHPARRNHKNSPFPARRRLKRSFEFRTVV